MSDTSHLRPQHIPLERTSLHEASAARRDNLLRTLRLLGADLYDLHLPETQYLPQLMKPHEKLLGILYGKYKHANNQPIGRGLIAATDQRLLFLDRKPFYIHFDELIYAVVSGITYAHVGFSTMVTISTRMGDVSFRTFNRTAARYFVTAVEQMVFKQQRKGSYDYNY